jgi:hypothetical protein
MIAIVTSATVVVIAVVMAVVLMVPMTFVHPPALSFVVVVGMAPICAFIRWLFPSPPNPLVATARLAPVSIDPDVAGAGRFSAALIARRRRTCPEMYRNLRCGRNYNCGSKYCTNKPFQFHFLYLLFEFKPGRKTGHAFLLKLQGLFAGWL